MGKKTLEKLRERELKEESFKNFFANQGMKFKEKEIQIKKSLETPLEGYIPSEFYGKRIREPRDFKAKFKTNDVDKKFVYFTKHLFCKYKTPKFFDKIIVRNKLNKEKFEWFVSAATGESLYKKYFKDFLTKKETHIFLNCPYEDFSIEEVFVYSVAFAECNDVGISSRIAKSKLREKNIRTDYWRNCIKFFANKDRVPESINDINDLVDYLQAEVLRNPNFDIFGNGFTLKSLQKRMVDWHYELKRAKEFGNFTWEGANIKDFVMYINKDKINEELIEIIQIKSSKELLNEGKVQHHCVFGYKQNCISGHCSIFSLRINGKIKVTIEVRGHSVVQARGFANRITRGEEDYIIKQWMNANGLSRRY